jgi:hypothetical protein
MDLTSLRAGQRVLFGSMKLRHKARADVYYGVGADLVNSDARRTVFFVAEYAPQQTVPGGTIIGRWRLYGFPDKNSTKWEALVDVDGKPSSGPIIKCTVPHNESEPHASAFFTCEGAHNAREAALASGLTFAQAREILTCSAAARSSAADTEAACAREKAREIKKYLGKAPLSLHTSAVRLFGTFDDDAFSSPYWFSCSLGCCTASMD